MSRRAHRLRAGSSRAHHRGNLPTHRCPDCDRPCLVYEEDRLGEVPSVAYFSMCCEVRVGRLHRIRNTPFFGAEVEDESSESVGT